MFNLTRYQIKPLPESDDLTCALLQNRFVSIDETTLANHSLGWARIFDWSAADFDPPDYNFGPVLAFNLRQDVRRVSPKVLGRYCALREKAHLRNHGKINALIRREIKEVVKAELLDKAPVESGVAAVYCLPDMGEAWLMAKDTKARNAFEELWCRTFGYYPEMIAPFRMALELNPVLAAAAFQFGKDEPFLDKQAGTKWLGEDFLLWLWSQSADLVLGASGREYSLDFGDNLVLKDGKEMVSCSGPAAPDWPEAQAAALNSKALFRAALKLTTEDMDFYFNLEPDTLTPQAIRLPLNTADGSLEGIMLERIEMLKELLAALRDIFAAFLDVRLKAAWENEGKPGIVAFLERGLAESRLKLTRSENLNLPAGQAGN